MLLSRAANGMWITPAQARTLHANRNLIIRTVRELDERVAIIRKIGAEVKRDLPFALWNACARQEVKERLQRFYRRQFANADVDGICSDRREYATRQALRPNLTYHDWHDISAPELEPREDWRHKFHVFNMPTHARIRPTPCVKCGADRFCSYWHRPKTQMCQRCAVAEANAARYSLYSRGLAIWNTPRLRKGNDLLATAADIPGSIG